MANPNETLTEKASRFLDYTTSLTDDKDRAKTLEVAIGFYGAILDALKSDPKFGLCIIDTETGMPVIMLQMPDKQCCGQEGCGSKGCDSQSDSEMDEDYGGDG